MTKFMFIGVFLKHSEEYKLESGEPSQTIPSPSPPRKTISRDFLLEIYVHINKYFFTPKRDLIIIFVSISFM